MKSLQKIVLDPKLRRFAEEVVGRAAILDAELERRIGYAFATVPREQFLEPGFRARAYQDVSLPIGFQQYSERPSTLARMISLLAPNSSDSVLELGSGSGYSAALLSSLGAYVYSLEVVGLLSQRTRKLLDSCGFSKVLIRRRDGALGWADHAPFDSALISFPIMSLPSAVFSQLRSDGGRVVALLGDGEHQVLTLFERYGEELRQHSFECGSFYQGEP